MKKTYEQMTRDFIEEISRNMAVNIAELIRLTGNGEISIDRLESLMGNLRSENNKVISKFYNDYIKTIPEKELIRKKKRIAQSGNKCSQRRQTGTENSNH